MNEPYPKGTKLWDKYFQLVVVVEKSFIETGTKFKPGRYYTVRYASGVVNSSHEDSFEPITWQRERNKRGHFMRSEIKGEK